MIFYFSNEWKDNSGMIKNIDVLPSVSLNYYKDYTFESIRFSWIGFVAGIGIDKNNQL